MPAIVTDAHKFLLNTDYPLDKIICMIPGQVTVPATDSVDVPIAHGLKFTPLMDGKYSTSPSFATDFDIGSGEPYPGSFGFFAINTSVDADATNANFHAVNFTSSPVTVYYRLFGFMPSNVNVEAPDTSSIADDFVLNTDFNYTKLFYADRLTSTASIHHGLGYRPQVAAWHEIIGFGIYKTIYADINNSFTNILVEATTQDVIVTVFSSTYAAHVRIYLDG